MDDNNGAETFVGAYIKLRDQVETVKRRQATDNAKELAPLESAMQACSDALHQILNVTGAQSVRTGAGTFYTETTEQYPVEDWEKVLRHILIAALESTGEEWQANSSASLDHHVKLMLATTELSLLEKRVAKTAAKELYPVPGVGLRTQIALRVRRA